jgi:hypothetical protein
MNYIKAIKRIAYELDRETHKDLNYGIPKDYLKGYLNGYERETPRGLPSLWDI